VIIRTYAFSFLFSPETSKIARWPFWKLVFQYYNHLAGGENSTIWRNPPPISALLYNHLSNYTNIENEQLQSKVSKAFFRVHVIHYSGMSMVTRHTIWWTLKNPFWEDILGWIQNVSFFKIKGRGIQFLLVSVCEHLKKCIKTTSFPLFEKYLGKTWIGIFLWFFLFFVFCLRFRFIKCKYASGILSARKV